MRQKYVYFFVIFGFFSYVLTEAALAQSSLKGIIVDAVTEEPLIGANVFIEGTAFGSATDLDGFFSMPRLPAGSYIITVSYIGYLEKKIPVEIKEDEEKIEQIKLEAGIIEGEVITVTGQAEGQAAAINRQLQATTITNVVSAERIQELPDANAAESLGRLPGISIKRSGGEANQIVIRGLAPTYNAITIAGERIPATDLEDRGVDLSMITPESIESIKITKALTPDMDGDAFGGTVDFQLAYAPDGGFKYDVRLEGGYNQLFSEFGNYKSNLRISNRYFNNTFGVLVTGNLEKAQRGSDQLSAEYIFTREKREGEEFRPTEVNTLSLRDRSEDRRRYGASLILDYKFPGGKVVLNNFLSRLDRDEIILYNHYSIESNWHERRYRQRETQIDIMTNAIAAEYDFPWASMDGRISRSASLQRRPYESYIRFKETSPFENLPDEPKPADLQQYAKDDLLNTHMYQGYLYTEEAYERDITAQLNIKIPYVISSQAAGSFKLGGKYRAKLRERDRNEFQRRLDVRRTAYEKYHTKTGQPGFKYVYTEREGYASFLNYVDEGFDPGNYLDGQWEFGPAIDVEEMGHLLDAYLLDSLYLQSVYANLSDYEMTEDVSAAYGMVQLDIGQQWMLLPGVRYEYTASDMTGRKGGANSGDEEPELEDPKIFDSTAVNNYGNWLPMIHFRYKPTTWFDIRLAYTKTLSRPRLDWMLPTVRILGSEQTIEMGVPDLKPQISTNYDAFLSFYGGWVGLFTVGGFYKEIQDLIYARANHLILDPEKEGYPDNYKGLSMSKPENNPFKTDVYGFEVEWQTNFRWLPAPFDGFVLYANYAHIFSETQFPITVVQQERIPVFPFILTTVVDTFRTGKMPDQADDIANLALGYDYGGFSGRISMLYQGKTLSIVGRRPEEDAFTQSLWRWDLSLKQDITDHFSIYLYWNNITNWPDEAFQQDTRYPTFQEYYGWTAALGVRVKM